MIQVCSYENRQTCVKGVLKHNKRQDISKLDKSHYHLQIKIMFNTWILRKISWFQEKNKKHGFLFHYNIIEDILLGICYVAVKRIRCSCL